MPRLKLAERTPPPDRASPTRFGGAAPESGSGGGGRPTAWRRVVTSFSSSARTSFQPAAETSGADMGGPSTRDGRNPPADGPTNGVTALSGSGRGNGRQLASMMTDRGGRAKRIVRKKSRRAQR